MAGQGSDNRQKLRSVLVRMTEREYAGLSERAAREGATRAEYMRRRMGEAAAPRPGHALPETDQMLLANATRSIGHLAGLMKLSILQGRDRGAPRAIQTLLAEHHQTLQGLQAQIHAILERARQ